MGNELTALGGRVRAIRESQGLSIRDLADMADLNKSQIVRIENGESDPHYTTLLRIAHSLGVRPSKLVDNGDDRYTLDEQKKE